MLLRVAAVTVLDEETVDALLTKANARRLAWVRGTGAIEDRELFDSLAIDAGYEPYRYPDTADRDRGWILVRADLIDWEGSEDFAESETSLSFRSTNDTLGTVVILGEPSEQFEATSDVELEGVFPSHENGFLYTEFLYYVKD